MLSKTGNDKSERVGWQIAVDCYNCDRQLINSQLKLEEFTSLICEMLDAKVVSTDYYLFEPYGISSYAIITKSHIAIHTWPEYGFLAIDIFTCSGSIAPNVPMFIKQFVNADKVVVNSFERGELINHENDIVEL